MRIGYDLQILRRNRGGTAVYTQQLLSALRSSYPADDFIPLDAALRLPRRNLLTKVGNALLDLAYLHIVLPVQALRAGVDVVHFPANMISARLACPSVVTIYDMMVAHMPEAYDPLFLKFFNWFVPPSARQASGIITISEFSKSDIVQQCRVSTSKVHVTPLGVAPSFVPQEREIARSRVKTHYNIDARPMVLYVGELNPRKNITTLISAFSHLRQTHPQFSCQLVLAGEQRDGAYRAKVLNMIREQNLEADVTLLGYVPVADLPSFYAAADALAYISLFEGFGLPAVEAMASGVPVVVSNRASLPEVVGEAGVLVDPLSVEEISDALYAVLADTMVRTRLVEAGLERAKLFRWEHTAEATRRIYRRVLDRN